MLLSLRDWWPLLVSRVFSSQAVSAPSSGSRREDSCQVLPSRMSSSVETRECIPTSRVYFISTSITKSQTRPSFLSSVMRSILKWVSWQNRCLSSLLVWIRPSCNSISNSALIDSSIRSECPNSTRLKTPSSGWKWYLSRERQTSSKNVSESTRKPVLKMEQAVSRTKTSISTKI